MPDVDALDGWRSDGVAAMVSLRRAFGSMRSLGPRLAVKSQEVVPSIQLEEADGSYAVSSKQEDRVDTHKNAPMTPQGRLRMVQAVSGGESIYAVAARFGVDRKTVRKWRQRFLAEGAAGLVDRSS